MMNADKQFYSGVPQDDWENKSKYPKILSNGPKIVKPKTKSSRNTGLISFLILTLVAIVLSLGIVVGLHYLKYSEDDGLVFDTSENETEAEVNKPIDDKISITTHSPVEEVGNKNQKDKDKNQKDKDKDKEDKGKANKDKEDKDKEDKNDKDDEDKDKHANSHEDQENDKKKDKDTDDLEDEISKNNITPKTESKNAETTTTKAPPQKPSTTTEDYWLDIIKTDDQLYNYADNFDNITTDSPSNNDEKNKKEETKDKNEESKDKKDKINDENKGTDIKNIKNNGTKAENTDDDDSESLSKIINNFTSKYFNSSSLRKEEILEWIEKLTARPSLEVIIIASGIIFVGLSLLIIAITCLLTRTRRVKLRRQKINKAMSDLEGGGEKVILLTDEPSEDEYVKTL